MKIPAGYYQSITALYGQKKTKGRTLKKGKKTMKAKKRISKTSAMNEPIYTWFERENPDELWAIERLSRAVTFADVYKCMSNGDGLGDDVEWDTDTRTRELILRQMAKLLKMKIEKLIEWSDSNAIAKEKRMQKTQG